MSETGAETGDTGAATEPDTDATSGSEDQEAEGLLAGMADTDPAELQSQIEHWKAQSRKWESRSRANSGAAAELEKIKQSGMTELEKAQAAQRAAEEARDLAQSNHARVMAAAAHNLPVELIDDLGSGTEDEINERAERISTAIENRARELAEQLVASRNGVQQTGGRPVESLRPGSQPSSGATPQTPDEWFRTLLQDRR